jgi:hypothetical protein
MAERKDNKEDSVPKIPSYRSTGFTFDVNRNLQYPLNIDTDHFVRFFINLDEESSYVRDKKMTVQGDVDQSDQSRLRQRPIDQDVFNATAATAAAVKGAQIGAANKWSAAASKKAAEIKGFKGNLKRALPKVAGAVVGGAIGAAAGYAVADQIKIDKKLKRLAAYITLYMPPSITNKTKASYGEFKDVVFDLMQNGSDEEVVKAVGKQGAASVAASLTRIVATAGSDLVSSATRTAVNPKKDLLFKAMDRRGFQFDFQFAPKSPEEAIEVANIIHCFRLFAHPEVIEGTMEYLYTFPAEFDIEYGIRQNGQESQNKYLNKISSCVLTDITINYSPGGNFQTLMNGEPVLTTMTLAFEEIETLHRDRIAKGY